MGLCEESEFLRLLPTSGWRIVWTWEIGNGTTVELTGSPSSRSDCLVEVVNLTVVSIVLLVILGFIVKLRCADDVKRFSSLLPFHTARSVLCMGLLIFLLLELTESFVTMGPLSPMVSILAVIACWFLHRQTEIRDGLGLGATGVAFFVIAVARIWRLVHLQRYGLSSIHVRTISTAGTAAICGLLAFIDSYVLYRTMRKSKRHEIRDSRYTRVSYRHEDSPFLSKLTFYWVVELLSRGFSNPLDLNDLGDLPDAESTVVQFQKFRRIYERRNKKIGNEKVRLWPCYWERVWPCFVVGGFLKLLGDATTLVGPMAISRIVDYVSNKNNSTTSRSDMKFEGFVTFSRLMENGYFVGLIMFIAAIVQSTLSQASTHYLNVEGIRLRTALQALVYEKSLRLYSWTIAEDDESSEKSENNRRKNSEKHSQVADIGTLTNLMAEDVYNVMSFFWIGHYTWAIPLKIVAIIFLLYLKLGISAIVGAICCIVIVTPMQLYLGKKMSKNLKTVAEKSDARLRLVNEILQGMRLVKLRAWEKLFEDRVRNVRNRELELLDKDSVYWALITFLTHASSVLTTLLTFGVYFCLEERDLDAGSVFASLALFSQLTVPLFIFPVVVPIIINATLSTNRLEDYLSLPEIVEVLPNNDCEISSFDDERPNSCFASDTTSQTDPKSLNSVGTFGNLGDIDENDEDHNLIGKHDSGIMNSSTDTIYDRETELQNLGIEITPLTRIFGKFTWDGIKNSLTVDGLDVPRGKLTLIVGRTGSGKTSLMSAMIGESQVVDGHVEWSRNVGVAYVSQKPWLLNATLRDNILFGSPYRRRRYRKVLRACALQPDVDVLPGRDLTRIGERGINLSGGQKQRITIARAIYSDADAVFMDDPLSALDQQVGHQIFEQGIQRLLLRKGRTVVMVTHRLEFLLAADQIVAMDGCAIRAIGTKASIEDTDHALAREWREAARRINVANPEIHRTAKDRWSLVRLVSRIGISVKNRNPNDGSWTTDRDAHVIPPSFVPLRLRRSTLSGSRYLAHDLTDLPVPAEEWGVLRRRSRKHPVAVRATSLQPPKHPPPVLRQSSTPTILECRYNAAPKKRQSIIDNGQNNSMLRQLFSGRSVTSEEATVSRERSVLRRLMSGSSSTNKMNQTSPEWDHRPLRRLISTESTTTVDIDEEQERVNGDDRETTISDFDADSDGLVTKIVWMDYLRAGGLAPGLGYLGAALGCQALRIYTDLWLSRWTDLEIRSQDPKNVHEETVFYFKMYVLLSVCSIICAALNSGAGQWAGAKARERLHEAAISGLLGAKLSLFERTPIGKILNRFSADMGVVDKKLSTALQRLTSFVLLCSSAILVNVAISPWFLVAAIPTCIIYYVLQRFYRRSARELQRLEGSTRGPVAAHFSETLAGLPIIRASKQQSRFMNVMIEHLDANTNAFLVLNTSSRWLGIALDYLGAVVVVAATFAALLTAEFYPNRVTPSLVGLAVNYTLLVPIYLNWVVKFVTEIEMYMGSVARLGSYAKTSQENYRSDEDDRFEVPKNWPEKGEIIFDNVTLRYNSQSEPVVHNLNLRIPAGQKLGICGRTGSGKSSTVMAPFQLVEVSQGRIIIDGVDIREISLVTLRSRLSAIPQDVIMFSGTIRENLDPLGEHSDDELWKALELAQMKQIVASHPEGLGLEVREGGENFSSGQLQLLSMARAALRRSSIVVLDEATSALDSTTEKELLGALTHAFVDKTVITIAHRVGSLMDCDRVVVFDEGRIVEEGTPGELVQRPMGFFTAMLRAGDLGNEKK